MGVHLWQISTGLQEVKEVKGNYNNNCYCLRNNNNNQSHIRRVTKTWIYLTSALKGHLGHFSSPTKTHSKPSHMPSWVNQNVFVLLSIALKQYIDDEFIVKKIQGHWGDSDLSTSQTVSPSWPKLMHRCWPRYINWLAIVIQKASRLASHACETVRSGRPDPGELCDAFWSIHSSPA